MSASLRLLLLASVLVAPGCVELGYERVTALTPVSDDAAGQLVAGESTLEDCLASFGAPTQVVELPAGSALAWTWLETRGWRVSVSVPLSERVNGSINFSDEDQRVQAVLCEFDQSWTMIELRHGLMSELTRDLERRRPRLIEKDSTTSSTQQVSR